MIINGPPDYHVVYTEAVRANLKILANRAKAAGQRDSLLTALRALDRRLRSEALSFGESLYALKKAGLEVRLGGEKFLSFRFGVNTKERLVIVIDCHVLGDPGF